MPSLRWVWIYTPPVLLRSWRPRRVHSCMLVDERRQSGRAPLARQVARALSGRRAAAQHARVSATHARKPSAGSRAWVALTRACNTSPSPPLPDLQHSLHLVLARGGARGRRTDALSSSGARRLLEARAMGEQGGRSTGMSQRKGWMEMQRSDDGGRRRGGCRREDQGYKGRSEHSVALRQAQRPRSAMTPAPMSIDPTA